MERNILTKEQKKNFNIFDINNTKFITEFYISNLASKMVYIDSIRKMLESVDLNPMHNVLDVGCGNGMFIRQIEGFGGSITGIDSSRNMIKLAKRCGLKANFFRMNCENLNFKDKRFDYVFSRAMFQHLSKKKHLEFFKEVKRVMKDDGTFIMFTPYRSWLGVIPREFSNIIVKGKREICGTNYPKSYITRVYNKTGFRINNIFYFGYIFFMLSGYGTRWRFPLQNTNLWRLFLKIDNLLTKIPLLRNLGLFIIISASKVP